MASTYENDLRLEEMATGENSGSWGTKTNTNLELIADAFSYGTETIANADTTITIADGAADAARSLALKINSSADLTTTRTITLAPNTTSKVWIIENNTSGGQVLTISAGSGSNVTLANGTTKIIATDGIGAGSNVVELTQDLAIADMSVDGILSLADGSNSAPSLTNTGDTNTGLYFPAADEVGITTGGTQRVKVDSTGVDITGTLVSDGLTVDGTATITTTGNETQLTLTSTDADATTGPNMTFYRNSASPDVSDQTGSIFFIGKDDAGNDATYGGITTHIVDASNLTEDGRLTISSMKAGTLTETLNVVSGNVGIGTSSPAANRALHVSSTAQNQARFERTGSATSQIEFNDSTTTNQPSLGCEGDSLTFRTSFTDRITITSTGSVGIGCTPDSTISLDVQNLSQSSNNVFLRLKNTTNLEDSGIIIDGNNGGQREYRIGVNTIVNSSDLTFSGGTGYQFKAGSTDVFSGDATEFVVATGVDLITNTAAGTSNFRGGFQAGDSIVASNAGVNNVMIGANAGTAIDSGDSNIAIGTDALLTEDDHANNIAIGYQALKDQDAGRDAYNVAIGYQAGLDTTTGFQNIFIGASAGSQASTADSTVAIGYNAGGGVSANPLTGNENTCVGFSAGKAIEGTTANNTFIGSQAGEGTTTGYENVALGYRAMHGNVQGRHNVAIGVQSLDVTNPSSAASQYNVAVGAYSGLANTTGIENVFLGGLSARNNTTANYNVMIGYAVGYNATTAGSSVFIGNAAAQGVDGNKLTGDNNTAVGKSAGLVLQGAAADNTFVGKDAGKSVTTAVQNTFVGSNCGDGTDDGSYNTAIGHEALGANCGNSNVAVGYVSLQACTGEDNTAIGPASGLSLISGNMNTFVGHDAGRNMSTGSKNVIIGGYDGNEGGLDIRTSSNNIVLSDGDGEFRQFIDSSGHVYWNTTSSSNYAQSSGSGNFVYRNDNGSTGGSIIISNNADRGWANAYWNKFAYASGDDDRFIQFSINGGAIGYIRCNSAGTAVEYQTTSDRRLKENIQDLTNGIAKVKQLRPRTFDWITDEDNTFPSHGFIADEADDIVPELVNGEANAVDEDGSPVYQNMEYSKLVPVLTAALKEAITKIETLEAKVTALENA